jgi:hypothetical protein
VDKNNLNRGRFFLLAVVTLSIVQLVHCSSMPTGQPGAAAEKLAAKMQEAAAYKEWQNIQAATFVFRGDDRVFWDKRRKLVEIKSKSNLVQFSELTGKSLCFDGERRILEGCEELTQAAIKKYYNHTFWINPAFHIMSPGTARELVDGTKLLVRYASGGSTPGDTYLFTLDDEGKITEMQMWVSILMIKGIRASFSDYQEVSKGIRVARHHKVGGLASVDLSDLQFFPVYPEASGTDRFQGLLELAGGPGSESINRKK